MSNIEPGSRTTSGSSNSSNQEKKPGFDKFRNHQPQPQPPPRPPAGSPPPEPSSAAPSPAVSWGGRGTGTGSVHPATDSSGASCSTAAARPMRPYHDGRVSNLQPEQDSKQEDATGSDREGGEEKNQCHDERAAEDQDGVEAAGWDQGRPDGVDARDRVPLREGEENEDEAEEREKERNPGPQVKQRSTPEAGDGAASTDGHGVSPERRKAGGGAAQRPQPLLSKRDYDLDRHQPQQSPTTKRSRGSGEEAFVDRDAQQPSPLPRPSRPELRRGDAVRQEQQEDPPQTHNADDFVTQASRRDCNNSSVEGSYGSDDELGGRSDDDLREPPVKDGEKNPNDRQDRFQHEQYDFYSALSRRSPVDHPSGRGGEEQEEPEEGHEEEAYKEEEEKVMESEKEGRERALQRQRHNQELEQRGVPRGGSITVVDNRSDNDEKAAENDGHEVLLGRSSVDKDEEPGEAEEEKRPRQGGRPQPQPQSSIKSHQPSPPPRGAKFNAFKATGDDDERAEGDENQVHDSAGFGGASSGQSERISGDDGAGAIDGGVDEESRFGLAPMSSSRRPVETFGSQGGPAAPKRAVNGPCLVVRSRAASDAEHTHGRAKRGGMKLLDGDEGGGYDDEGFTDEEGKGVKRKREESQAVLGRKVKDSFERITNSFLSASRMIRDVEAEQTKMIRSEEMIKRSLLKSGTRVREATRAMQKQLLAAFTGDGNDEDDLTDEPRGAKGRVVAPPLNNASPRRPTASSGARAAATAASQLSHGEVGGDVRGRDVYQPGRPRDQQVVSPSVDVAGIHGSSDAGRGHNDGDWPPPAGRFPVATSVTIGVRADRGKQKLGRRVGGRPVDRSSGGVSGKWSPPAVAGHRAESLRGTELESAPLRPRHAQGAIARGSGASSMPNSRSDNGGGASGLVGGDGRGGRFSSSSSSSSSSFPSAKRPCRADFARERVIVERPRDERA